MSETPQFSKGLGPFSGFWRTSKTTSNYVLQPGGRRMRRRRGGEDGEEEEVEEESCGEKG